MEKGDGKKKSGKQQKTVMLQAEKRKKETAGKLFLKVGKTLYENLLLENCICCKLS